MSSNPISNGSCFFYSQVNHYTKQEVITLAIIGELFLITLCIALYGYIGDPSWLTGANCLFGIATTLCISAFILVAIKNCFLCRAGRVAVET